MKTNDLYAAIDALEMRICACDTWNPSGLEEASILCSVHFGMTEALRILGLPAHPDF